MAQRLYVVTVETMHEIVVIADDKLEAEEIAKNAIEDGDGLGDEQYHADVRALDDIKNLPWGWDETALPFGKDQKGERQIAEILTAAE